MPSLFSTTLEQRLLSDYNTRMHYFPIAKAEVDAYLAQLDDREHKLSLICMYAYMPESDIISYSPALIDSFVVSSLKVRQLIPYAANVAPIDFLTYVMFYRINNENIEEYRESFFQELYPRVQGLTITQAALEVNYWCFEKATYCSADGRTASPLTTIRRTRGRCGEESTLCAAALRSVGIPTRQVYVPWWAHTESNHAWIEFQIEDGTWHFLGACEPEAVPDKGWFTVPGTRSMNMVARTYTKLLSGDNILETSPISQFINCTARYAPVTKLTIRVTEHNQPVVGASIALKIANWHHLVAFHYGLTDTNGMFSIETGIGSIMVHISDKKRMINRLIHTKECTFLDIPFEEAIDYSTCRQERTEFITLTPPPALPDRDYGITPQMQQAHDQRIKSSEAIRLAYEATFQTKALFLEKYASRFSPEDITRFQETKRDYMAESRGNYPVLEQFLLSEAFTMEEKLLLLDSMNEKDMVDTKLPTFLHTLEVALPYRDLYPEEIFKRDVLSPRIGFSLIEDNRLVMKQFLEEHNIPKNGGNIWNFLKQYVSIVPKEASGSRHLGSPIGALKNRICSAQTFDVLFVSMCRAAGIPARMERRDRGSVYYENGHFRSPELWNQPLPERFPITICDKNNMPLQPFRDFMIEKYENGDFGFAPLMPPPRGSNVPPALALPEGYYRIVCMEREENGTARLAFQYFYLNGPKTIIAPSLEKSHQVQWLQHSLTLTEETLVTLSPTQADSKPFLASQLLTEETSTVWMVLNPGKEPTEHILNEMMSHQEAYNQATCQFRILLTEASDFANPTLQKALKAIPSLTVYLSQQALLDKLFQAEPSNDIRLPFVAFMDVHNSIRHVWTGYQIGTAEQILTILEEAKQL